jgi:hypothetical protein
MELVYVQAAQDTRVHPYEDDTSRVNLEVGPPLACRPHSGAEVAQTHQAFTAAEGGGLEAVPMSASGRGQPPQLLW